MDFRPVGERVEVLPCPDILGVTPLLDGRRTGVLKPAVVVSDLDPLIFIHNRLFRRSGWRHQPGPRRGNPDDRSRKDDLWYAHQGLVASGIGAASRFRNLPNTAALVGQQLGALQRKQPRLRSAASRR